LSLRQATLVGLLIAGTGCAKLPGVTGNECGNGVVEGPREDCDGFAPAGMSCRAKGSVGECHLDCRPHADGTPSRCPAGWGCDLEGLCRTPTGEFEPPAQVRAAGAWTLMAGDFDGDGRADVIGREPLDVLGRSKIRIHYLDAQGGLGETRAFPKLVGLPNIVDISGDRRDDLVFTNRTLGVLLGQADRSWLPESFGSYRFEDSSIRTLAISGVPMPHNPALVVLATIGGAAGIYVPDPENVLQRLGDLPGGVEALAGDPASGDLIADPLASPCAEVVIAARGATSFSVVDTCLRAADGSLGWRKRALVSTVPLEPPDAIDSGALVADVNGDGHLDVMVGAAGRAFVAYGDGHQLAPAHPYLTKLAVAGVPGPQAPMPIAMPLAVGDFTGDGLEDFVFPDHLLYSGQVPGTPAPIYNVLFPGLAAPWTVARIADLNGNGKPDVVAASRTGSGIDFLNGTGTTSLLAFNVQTNGPVLHLEVGDLDGDLVNDLSFVEAASSEPERDAVRVAYGNLAGAPSQPATVARIKHAEQLAIIYENGVAGLMVASSERVAGRPSGVLSILSGGGDRLPYAPFQLADPTPSGALQLSVAIGTAVGAFTAPGQHDVLAFGADREPVYKEWMFWLLPALSTTQSNKATRIGGKVDPRVLPAEGAADMDITINLATAASDVDGDGRDEGLFAMPADENRRCAVMVVGVLAQSPAQAVVRDTVVLDLPCFRPDLSVVDADDDGRPDLALLTGAAGEKTRKLVVLWNDGKGGFSAARTTVVSGADSPQQFTTLAAIPARPFSFAYVTDGAALITSSTGPRAFGPARKLTDLPGGSGIVAADVNGDGVQDLVLAASGNLSIWKARLKSP
jgi:hypothetical protein